MLGRSRYWYDRQLGDLFDWWEMNGTAVNSCPPISSLVAVIESPNYYRQKQQLPIVKKDSVKVVPPKIVPIVLSGKLLDFTPVDSTIFQQVSQGVERAFERFFAGKSEGNRSSGKHRLKTVNAAINLKKLRLGIFHNIKHPSGNFSLVGTMDNSTAKEILHTLL